MNAIFESFNTRIWQRIDLDDGLLRNRRQAITYAIEL